MPKALCSEPMYVVRSQLSVVRGTLVRTRSLSISSSWLADNDRQPQTTSDGQRTTDN